MRAHFLRSQFLWQKIKNGHREATHRNIKDLLCKFNCSLYIICYFPCPTPSNHQAARASLHSPRDRRRGAVRAADKLKIFHPTTLLNWAYAVILQLSTFSTILRDIHGRRIIATIKQGQRCVSGARGVFFRVCSFLRVLAHPCKSEGETKELN